LNAGDERTITGKSLAIRWAMVSSVAAGLAALGIAIADANPPSSDQPCSVRHATLRDADGRMMRCDRLLAGTQELVWQYPLGS
jgi:hypothetical protein